jgi:hypothetical protein
MKAWILFFLFGAVGFGLEENGDNDWQKNLPKGGYDWQPTKDDFWREAKLARLNNDTKEMWQYIEEAARLGSDEARALILFFYREDVVGTESCIDWHLCASLPEHRQKLIKQPSRSQSTLQFHFLNKNYFEKLTPEQMIQYADESFRQKNYGEAAYYLQQAARLGLMEAKSLMEIYKTIDIKDKERRNQFLEKCFLLLGNDETKKRMRYNLCRSEPGNLLKSSVYMNIVITRKMKKPSK